MIYDECEYCKNHYSGCDVSDGCSKVFYQFEMDDNDDPIKVDGVCHGFKRSGLFKELPYRMKDTDLRRYISDRIYTLLNDYSANDLLEILHEDLEKDVITFLEDYFYDAAIANGVCVTYDPEVKE